MLISHFFWIPGAQNGPSHIAGTLRWLQIKRKEGRKERREGGGEGRREEMRKEGTYKHKKKQSGKPWLGVETPG